MSDVDLRAAVDLHGGVTPSMTHNLDAFAFTVRNTLAGFPPTSQHPAVEPLDQILDLLDALAAVGSADHCHLPEVGRMLHDRGGPVLMRSSYHLIRAWIGEPAGAYMDAAWAGIPDWVTAA